MPIPIPVTKTRIATVPWGIPITNEVNRLTTVTTPTPWTALPLSNGWVATVGWQAPQYRKIGDMVYLRGNISSGAAGVFATLPVGFRPPSTESFAVGKYNTGSDLANVAANGICDTRSTGQTSLSGISFSTIA